MIGILPPSNHLRSVPRFQTPATSKNFPLIFKELAIRYHVDQTAIMWVVKHWLWVMNFPHSLARFTYPACTRMNISGRATPCSTLLTVVNLSLSFDARQNLSIHARLETAPYVTPPTEAFVDMPPLLQIFHVYMVNTPHLRTGKKLLLHPCCHRLGSIDDRQTPCPSHLRQFTNPLL